MRFFIVDDDEAVRSMLAYLIEEEELGSVVGEAEDGFGVDAGMLAMKAVDVLLIDLLMPIRDGIETVRSLKGGFGGKIIMISQVESKEMIGAAYEMGIEYYITKPINRLEVISIFRKVSEKRKLELSIREIERSLSGLGISRSERPPEQTRSARSIAGPGNVLLSELGMIGEAGCKDLLGMLEALEGMEQTTAADWRFPPLQELFAQTAASKLGPDAGPDALRKEIKAAEQRVRRSVGQALNHLASLGLTDYANPKFENYASKFFEFSEVRKKMRELETGTGSDNSGVRLNVKKFVQVLYLEAKQMLGPQ
ncbi:response regulator [Paenibacillus mesophilus]|uniref:DNA-binding domain-containing protein n=1 Tax=Paenibacillus mesophilus TaxID=2582849 RepID=UPI00110EB59C|nr:DNA-binding domain-containing protein [Paenibacillus mesophilus]TMV52131.1 response regulator [Paenibacillus mesophilus]